MIAHTYTSKKLGAVSSYLIANKWAHDEASANKLLVFIAIIFFLFATIVYYIFVVKPSSTATQVNIPERVIQKLPPETQAKIRASKQQ